MFNRSRVLLARERRGVTKEALAAQSQISTRSLAAYESGAKTPAPRTIKVIAESLGFPISFFEGADLREPPHKAISFRALSHLSARDRDRAISSSTFALSLSQWIDARFNLPAIDVPRLP